MPPRLAPKRGAGATHEGGCGSLKRRAILRVRRVACRHLVPTVAATGPACHPAKLRSLVSLSLLPPPFPPAPAARHPPPSGRGRCFCPGNGGAETLAPPPALEPLPASLETEEGAAGAAPPTCPAEASANRPPPCRSWLRLVPPQSRASRRRRRRRGFSCWHPTTRPDFCSLSFSKTVAPSF